MDLVTGDFLSDGQEAFDFISVTPPYEAVDYAVLMDQLEKSSLIGKDTFVVSVL